MLQDAIRQSGSCGKAAPGIDRAGTIRPRRYFAFSRRRPALIVMSPSEADFTAEPIERLSGPEEPTPGERKGWALALIAAAALHLIIPLALIVYYALWPPIVPVAQQEIPVEVVVEQPTPKPDKTEDKPKPPPEPEDEKPAYDAPAAATQEEVNRESPDKVTQAPAAAAAPPPTPGSPLKTDAQSAPPPHDLKPMPEGDQPADLNPTPDENVADAAEPAAPAPPAKAPVGAPLPTIETLPQYKFARAVRDSPIATGNADSRYFTIIYGMIRSHLREPSGFGAPVPNKQGAVIFGVDESGNLIGRKMVTSSGSPNLDMAVMAAIAEAAPYPAPPNWQPRTMRLTYGR
jgi:TonB family protein